MLIFEVKLINNMGRKPIKKHVFLTGYMGSGKTTIGLLLSKHLSLPFIDLDNEIEEDEKMPISEIFKKKGEDYFRNKESNMLKKIIKNNDAAVIALGGGSISNSNNLNAIKIDGLLIYLEASASTIVNRIKNEASKRPLLTQFSTDDALLNFIEPHINSRLKNYQKADIAIKTDEKNWGEIISEITEIIGSNIN